MIAPEASQLLTPLLKKPEPMKPEPNLQLFWYKSCMFSPFLHGLSSSICNLCLQATWNRVSPIPSTMRLQFSPALVGDISVSKACVSLGDDEPFGTSPGSSSK